jgi:hypothetical protein
VSTRFQAQQHGDKHETARGEVTQTIMSCVRYRGHRIVCLTPLSAGRMEQAANKLGLRKLVVNRHSVLRRQYVHGDLPLL